MDLKRRIFAGFLAASLGVLSACSAAAEAGETPMPQPTERNDVVLITLPPTTPPPPPEPTPTPGPSWDTDHSLGMDLTDLTQGGLELPIHGATGYTSVKLGLWAEKPKPSPPPSVAPVETPPPPTETMLPSPTPESAVPSETPTDGPPEGIPTIPTETPPAETSAVPPSPATEVPPAPVETAASPGSTVVATSLRAVTLSAPQTQALGPESTPVPTAAPTPTPDPFAGAMAILPPGSAFTILEESGSWWRVRSSAGTGWVNHTFCMINLPDVVPSIVYDATNSYDSRYTTSGRPLPGITGEGLYTGKVYNPRFDEEEYLMPVLYAMAGRIGLAQHNALAQGNSLKIYEAYRPYAVQKAVLNEVSRLANQDPEVKSGVSDAPWGVQWFISTGYSNHQRGYAIDVSLVKVLDEVYMECGGYGYLQVEQYEEYVMPTPIHELSIAAATFTEPVPVYSQTAWKKAVLATGMNAPALGLQRYCTDAGLTPLASEWWHFNDVNAYTQIQSNQGVGGFEIKTCVSTAP